jgi:hypothetical protein
MSMSRITAWSMIMRVIAYCLVVMTIVVVSMSTLAAQPARMGSRPMVAYEFTGISAVRRVRVR